MTSFTKEQLAQIIQEEYEAAMQDVGAGLHLPARLEPGPAPPPGDPNFMAIRQLSIMARDASLSFEDNIIKQLALKDPNSMDANSQSTYRDAMESMQSRIESVVIETIRKVAELPKEEKTAA